MYNVAIIGHKGVGKSSLCMQWTGHEFSPSYCATLFAEKHELAPFVLVEIPAITRFAKNLEQYYANTDIFVLVVNQDCRTLPLFETLSQEYKEASWLIVLNGPEKFPKCRSYVSKRDIYMVWVDLKKNKGVAHSFELLDELSKRHQKRPEPFNLIQDVYLWLPTCY